MCSYVGTENVTNYWIHKVEGTSNTADVKTDGTRRICIREDVMTAILGSDWTTLLNEEGIAEFPGTFIEQDIYVLYIGGNNSYYQLVILDESWVSVSQ